MNTGKDRPESTASTSRSMASIFMRGEIKNWENLERIKTDVTIQNDSEATLRVRHDIH